ncbi:MAG: hypothetical protein Q9O74_03300 [Planctomycetota bacterium]|nr:hypothetical protein [Planctomycetota bacterium]
MQPTDSAFDRVKSLLGKMDRSIDEARQRRLDDEDPTDNTPGGNGTHNRLTDDDQAGAESPSNGSAGPDGTNGVNGSATPRPTKPARPASKYGRAKPIRDDSKPNPAQWRQA